MKHKGVINDDNKISVTLMLSMFSLKAFAIDACKGIIAESSVHNNC